MKENGNVIHERHLNLSNSVGTFYSDEGVQGGGGKEHLVKNLIALARDLNTLVTYFYIGVAQMFLHTKHFHFLFIFICLSFLFHFPLIFFSFSFHSL